MRRAFLAICAALAGTGGWSAPAQASDWGCEVLLCLSNPSGATQFPQCVDPIGKLWSQLAMGKSFPTCTGGGVTSAKVYNQKSPMRRYVTMTYSDGSRKTYSLANIKSVTTGSTEQVSRP